MKTKLPIVELRASAEAAAEHMIEVRRKIHAHPELGLQNPRTQAVIVAELDSLGITEPICGRSCTSVVADIHGTAEGPGGDRCVALRADTDALPLKENAAVDWASQEEGRMHACGHDGHVAMLLGAARVLMEARDRFAGTVRLLFQPGEEGYGGAHIMIEEGALEGVEAAFAIHLEPSVAPNVVAWRRGAILAAQDTFRVVFKGSGGHASMPHRTRDPVPAIGAFVDGLSHVVARETDPDDRIVISVTRVEAGTAFNVIPPTVKLGGTIRTLSPIARERAHTALSRVAEGVAQACDLQCEVAFHHGYPPTINDARCAAAAADVAGALGLQAREMPSAYMGAEDFSYVLERVPGAMVFLGAQVADGGPMHSDLMKFDESVMPSGAALHAAVALATLAGE